MEQPQYNSYKVRKLDDPEEKKLAILKATQSIESLTFHSQSGSGCWRSCKR